MNTKVADSCPLPQHGETPVLPPAQPGSLEHQGSHSGNTVLKSGPLFLSSKGIGWTSWKKRWFVLTRTSLVFFRSDPTAAPQRSGEANLTLGGIDLNNSGSVDVKSEKKLLTVFFPDGGEGRCFTLKAETLEDLKEWKNALESALAQAPSITTTAQNGTLKGDQADSPNGPSEHQKDRKPVKSMVIGRPILLALQEIDGSPTFLEKALKFLEEHGFKTEGILRQAADVEEVDRRVREYEQGKTEFSPDEDAHVIADCVKHVLRELPSAPVPASCCNALLEAYRSDRNRVNAMRTAVLETFPEPNRKLLQRILMTMTVIASHKAVNRMSTSAVAACMSPLLLRPLLAGDCDVENQHFDVAGDNSLQLLQAAAAANHAQAIIIMLLDEYDKIFGTSPEDGSLSTELFTDSEASGSGSEDATDDYDEEDDEYGSDELDEDQEYGSDEQDKEAKDDYEHSTGESCSGSDDHEDDDSDDGKQSEGSGQASKSLETCSGEKATQKSLSASSQASIPRSVPKEVMKDTQIEGDYKTNTKVGHSGKSDINGKEEHNFAPKRATPHCLKSASTSHGSGDSFRRTSWGHTSAKKNLSMESIEFSMDDEEEIRRLETAKKELEVRITEEANCNTTLQESLSKRKKSLHERRLALERDVDTLEEQLQRERDLRAALEAELTGHQAPVSANNEEKKKGELREMGTEEETSNHLKRRVDDRGSQVSQQPEENFCLLPDRNIQSHHPNRINKKKLNEAGFPSQNLGKSAKSKGKNRNNLESTGDDDDKGRKCVTSSSRSQSPHIDTTSSNSSGGGMPINACPIDAGLPRLISSSKRNSLKGEVTGSTTSTLSKLTTRLNFLKEKRTQIASEILNLDQGWGSGSSSHSEMDSWDKKQQGQEGSSGGTNMTKEDDRTDKRVGNSREGCSSPTDKDGGKRGQNSSDGRRGLEDQGTQQHDRVRSETSRKADKDRRSFSKTTSR